MAYKVRENYSVFGAIHHLAVRKTVAKYNEMKPYQFNVLLLCDEFFRRGGFFTFVEVVRFAEEIHESTVKRTLRKLLKSEMISQDATIVWKPFCCKFYEVTIRGQWSIKYYNRVSGLITKRMYEVGHKPKKYNNVKSKSVALL